MASNVPSFDEIVEVENAASLKLRTTAPGPEGSLPLTPSLLEGSPSGDLFGLSQNAGMGWSAAEVTRKPYLILSTQGGVRADDGRPIALGYHTGHWEVGLLVAEAARELAALGALPHAGCCTDPCDGRTQGTPGMMDSLPYRNDAAIVLRRLMRSLPTRAGVLGVATCDKGLPAMMMALAGAKKLPCVLVPGGVMLATADGEDTGRIQSIGARYAHGEITLERAAELACRTCASPGGGCQFLGTAATSQVVGEALGLALPHAALAPSGEPVWLDLARRSARALVALEARGIGVGEILTPAAVRNAMVVHAAFGGSTNLILHIPAIAHAAGLARPTVEDWHSINQRVPRLVDVLPNGPVGHPTVRVHLAGGVPEVMLQLRALDLLDLDVLTVAGVSLARALDWWEASAWRRRCRAALQELDGVDPNQVILTPESAEQAGLTSTVTFPRGNLAPEGSVVKSTAIDPTVIDADGVYRKVGPARVFTREIDAIQAIKRSAKDGGIAPGEIIVLTCGGPMGTGMEEIFQITAALRYLSFGKEIALLTDARFSGVSTGACIGHVSPEALAGGPLGKVLDGDRIRIEIDCQRLEGSVDLVGDSRGDLSVELTSAEGAACLAARPSRSDLARRGDLPEDTRLWAALQARSGGPWGGCVYDVNDILRALEGPA